jgi:hypothetical protein
MNYNQSEGGYSSMSPYRKFNDVGPRGHNQSNFGNAGDVGFSGQRSEGRGLNNQGNRGNGWGGRGNFFGG